MKFARKVTKPLYLYGKGNLGKLAKEIFEHLSIPFVWVDGTSPPEFIRRPSMTAVAVTTFPYNVTSKGLRKIGYKDIVPVWDIIRAYPETGLENGFGHNLHYANSNASNIFKDELSLRHYRNFFIWTRNRQEEAEFMPTPINEIAPQKVLESGLWKVLARKRIGVTGEDEPWLFIHAEGLELQVVCHYMWTIKNDRPRISVACYHSIDGVMDIPHFLYRHLPNYNFYFRQHAYMGQAAYMYCIPKEKDTR